MVAATRLASRKIVLFSTSSLFHSFLLFCFSSLFSSFLFSSFLFFSFLTELKKGDTKHEGSLSSPGRGLISSIPRQIFLENWTNRVRFKSEVTGGRGIKKIASSRNSKRTNGTEISSCYWRELQRCGGKKCCQVGRRRQRRRRLQTSVGCAEFRTTFTAQLNTTEMSNK